MVTNNLTGLSTDTKPYAEKESLFLELDTGNWYYCTGGNAWTKVDGLSGVKVDNALIGKSTDGKPNASENTIFIEVDTGKTYYRNSSSWAEIPSGGGGGGANQAEVEIKTYSNNNIPLMFTYGVGEDDPTFPFRAGGNLHYDGEPKYTLTFSKDEVDSGSGTLTLPLMGNDHLFHIEGYLENITVETSGGVTYTNDDIHYIFTVTGDGTITFR